MEKCWVLPPQKNRVLHRTIICINIPFCNLLAACLTFSYPATLLPNWAPSSDTGKLCSHFTGVSWSIQVKKRIVKAEIENQRLLLHRCFSPSTIYKLKQKVKWIFSFHFSEEREQSTLTELARDRIALCFLLPRHFSAWNLACPGIPSAPFLPMYIPTSACSERATSALQTGF